MAAQKLTKGRFIQIIIMLTLLMTAFFWRTYTYKEPQKVTCKLQQSCSFNVNNAVFYARYDSGLIRIVVPNDKWKIADAVKIKSAGNNWQVESQPQQVIQLINVDDKETYKRELIFLAD